MSYTLKEQLAASGNYGGSRSAGQIKYLVIHYTGNDGDSASANAAYFQNHVVKASAHYFVDDSNIFRSVPDLRIAWAVGGSRYASAGCTGGSMHGIISNGNSISVELCGTMQDGTCRASEATLSNAVALCVKLMDKYDIPLENVYRHFDVTGKLCPAYLVDFDAWAAFKVRLKTGLADNIPAAYAKEAVEWAQETGIMSGNADGNLMLSQPLTRQQFAAILYRYAKLDGRA